MKTPATNTEGPAAISRRKFISGTVLTAAALNLGTPVSNGTPASAAPKNSAIPLIDTNVTLFHWPMRRLPHDEPDALVQKLRGQGVIQAWAGSFEGLLHRDIAAVNARLATACLQAGRKFFVPFGTINPAVAGWRNDLARCREEHSMPGIRVFPGYHGYKLDSPQFSEFLDSVQQHKLLLQIVVTIEDVRVQHPRMQAAPVDLKPLPGLLASRPNLKIVLLNWNRAGSASVVPALTAKGNVFVDIATIEGVGGISALLKQVPARAILFGSHAPYYYFESALLKLKESDLTPDQLSSIRLHNAQTLLG